VREETWREFGCDLGRSIHPMGLGNMQQPTSDLPHPMADKCVVVTGAFDNLGSGEIRFLEEAAKLGQVTVLLWADPLVQQVEGKAPRFPQAEREYVLRAIRFVKDVHMTGGEGRQGKSEVRSPKAEPSDPSEVDIGLVLESAGQAGIKPDVLVVSESQHTASAAGPCLEKGIEYRVLGDEDLRGLPTAPPLEPAAAPGRKRVIVTGCYDWVHSGHVRFFEEVSAYGDLYVVLGHDANLRLLKGPGHPHFPQEERRYVVSAIRYVTQALISSGNGWLDAAPEIERVKPDIYVVNEDGDRGGKREYCAQHGIEYLVLKRAPAPGLPPRTSTELRGF
jgi:cytidyltransferase-like protein